MKSLHWLALLAAAALALPAAAQDGASIRLAPREGAATPTLFLSDEAFTLREGVDRSLFGVRPDTPMAIPAGRRIYMVLAFQQYHPGLTWKCEVQFSFESRAGNTYRVTHNHRFREECGAEVIDLSTGATADGFRLEPLRLSLP